MELLPIIKASLGIFTLLVSTTFFVSYVTYKIKNRDGIKPHQRKPVVFDSNLILEVHDNKSKKIKRNSHNKKFEILNEYERNTYNDRALKKESTSSLNEVSSLSLIENPNHIQPLKTSRRSPNEVFNIYNFYSNNLGLMHKLKVKTLTAE